MAEETQAPAASEAPAAAAAAEVVAVPPEEEKAAVKEPEPAPPAPVPEPEEEAKKPELAKVAVEEEKKEEEAAAAAAIPQSGSFKEESNVVADLDDPEKKALDEFKQLVQAALANNEFTKPPPLPPKEEEKPAEKSDEPAATTEKAEESAATVSEKADESAAAAAAAASTSTSTEKVEESATEAPAKVEEEAPKPETKDEAPLPLPKTEEKEELVAVVVTAKVEKAVVIDDDGAKTVEAIEETVVAVAATPEPVTAEEPAPEAPPPAAEEIHIWGVPLLADEKSDTILLKFLRARDFKVKDAFAMIKDTVIWRKDFGIEDLLSSDLGVPPELEKEVVFMHGHDKEGHPVCYNVYGGFQDKDLYQKVFADQEKREKFLRWRIQILEKGIREQLDFNPSGICTMVQVTDLKNSPGPGKKELRQATNRALALLQDNYPEFVAKQVFINVPWWYLAFNRMISPFLTQRTKSKFVFAGPSKTSETLFKYIAPEQVPVQYGGLSMGNDADFSTSDTVTEITIKPSTKHTIEIPVSENSTLVWELRVLGWDVSYGAEFVPSAEDGYTVIVQKTRKFTPSDEAVVKNTFKIGESGKIVLIVDNTTSKKKKLLYRSKAKSSTE